MTKAALSAYSRTVALELAPKGIRCNVVTPGMVNTPLIAPTGDLTEEQLKVDEQRYPLGRYGNPQDIAWAIVYLLSDASCWMTGSTVKIDGGISLV
jgi:NAD(P)-dependent dehydrogenase (short-subunit alcohol dehydrogenase family)